MIRWTFRVFLVLAVLLVSIDANAIPAFARKYQLSCSTCHAPAPRLKPYGEEFAARGFRMEKPEDEPSRATHDTGDPLLMLLREFPVAARIDLHATYQSDAASDVDFETPVAFKVLSGGPISKKMSYYLYFIIEEGDVVGLEDTFVQYSGLFNSSVDLIAGQFQVSDPLFKRELRLSRNDYEIYKVHVGEVPSNLTYDRGVMFLATVPGDVDAILTIVNGNGIPEGEFDDDSNKNFALRLAREFGRTRIGLFGYYGQNDGAVGENTVTYVGPDLVISGGDRWQLNAEYLVRNDDNPWLLADGAEDVTTEGGFAELHYFPKGENGRYAFTLLYNNVDSDDPAAIRESVSLTLNYLLARNIRLLTEIGRDIEADGNMASIGLAGAF